MPKFVQRFAEGMVLESEKEVLEFVRGYLLKKIDPVTPGSLIKAIKENTSILPNINQERHRRTMQKLLRTRVARKMWAEERHKINAELVLKWLMVDRPDLCSVIINWPDDAARKWLETNIEQIKKELLNINASA